MCNVCKTPITFLKGSNQVSLRYSMSSSVPSEFDLRFSRPAKLSFCLALPWWSPALMSQSYFAQVRAGPFIAGSMLLGELV